MAAEDITFEQGAGEPNQLPQGAATELNAQLPTETAAPPQSDAVDAAAQAVVPVEPAAPADYEPQYVPDAGSDEELITGPSFRPEEPVSAGTYARPQPSPEVIRSLPALQRLASEPDADPQLVLLVQMLLRDA